MKDKDFNLKMNGADANAGAERWSRTPLRRS